MLKNRANSSLVAILLILLVMAGVIYLFWQNALTAPVTEETAIPTEEIISPEDATTDAAVSEEVSTETIDEVIEATTVTEEETVTE